MKQSIPVNNWTDKDVEAHWDAVSEMYVRENERVKVTHDQRFHATIQLLELKGARRILNITSRDGEASDYIERDNPQCEIINAEISSGLMEVARRLRPRIKQKKIETYSALPFNDVEFDRVICLETLEHVSEPLTFLSELHRVSSGDAIMVLTCPPATSEIPYRIYSMLFGGHGEGPHRFPPSKRVKKMLQLTGWVLTEHRGTLLIPVGPERVRQLGEKIIRRLQDTCISELGIRQIYVCRKQ